MPEDVKKSQLDRFKEAARQIDADENNDALDKAFGRLNVKQPPGEKSGDGDKEKQTPDQ